MKRDKRVSSWAELQDALYDIPKSYIGRYRSSFVYRGVADKDWGLRSSLQRLGPKFPVVERPLIRSFAKYAQPGDIPSDTLWFRLAVAQHHGLPTRLLDWTVSPKVAVHFATSEEEHFDKDAAIWMVDVERAQDYMPRKLIRTLDREYAYLFSIEMLQNIVPTLQDFDRLGRNGKFVIFFEPPSLDGRIVNQAAVMSAMPGSRLDLRAFLEAKAAGRLYRRIVIPKELKWEIRDKLDQDNVTERMLFPGLDGLSRWLKRYYGPGPTVKPAAKNKLPTSGRGLP
jgi:hypothetical protein